MRSARVVVLSCAVAAVGSAALGEGLANLPGVDFEPGRLRLPLTVHERSGVPRTGVVVTSGVPFPTGFLTDVSKLRVVDAAGKAVPCQATVMSRWWKPTYDDSVRWALVSFMANVKAKSTATYFLTDAGGPVPKTGLKVMHFLDLSLRVRTGPAEFAVPASRNAIISRATVGGKDVIDGKGLRAEITGGDWPEQGMKAGVVHTSDIKKATIEEQGPVRVVVLVEGTHTAKVAGATKDGLYDFESRLYFTAGSAAVRIVHTLKNSRLKNTGRGTTVSRNLYVWPFTDYSLVADLALGKTATATALGEKAPVRHAGDGTLKVYQDSSGGTQWKDLGQYMRNYSRWLSPWTKGETVRGVTFRGYTVTAGGEAIGVGNHAPGAADVSTGTAGVSVAFRDFWQQYPKAVEVGPKRLRIGLWPDEFDDVFFLDSGQRKSYDLVLDLHTGMRKPGALKALSDAHDRTLLFRAPPAWYVRCGSFDAGLALIKPPRTSGRDTWNKTGLDGVHVGWDWYGWISGWNSGGGHWNQSTHFAPWALFGDGASFDAAEVKTLWAADLTPLNYDTPDLSQFWLMLRSWNLRENRVKKHTFPGYYRRAQWGLPDSGHMAFLIWPEYYYLTGDRRALKAIESLGIRARAFLWSYNHDDRADGLGPLPGPINWCTKRDPDDPTYRLYNRYIGWPLYDLAQWYQLTGNAVLRPECQSVAAAFRNTGRWSPTGFLCGYLNEAGDKSMYGGQTHHGRQPPTDSASQCYAHFQMGIMASGLVEYYRETLDEEALDTLVGFADLVCHHAMLRDAAGAAKGWTYVFGDYWGPYSMADLKEGRGASFMASNFRVTQPLGHIYQYTGRKDYLAVLKAAVGSLRAPSTGVIAAHKAVLHPHVDTTPPAAVTDLAAGAAGSGKVTLTWTAPGDDANAGAARRYQLKYAPTKIVERVTGWPDRTPPLPKTKAEWVARVKAFQAKQIAFWQAFNAKGEPTPRPAGAKETFTVTGLKPGRYWFALKTFDDGPNMSDLSNVVAVTVK